MIEKKKDKKKEKRSLVHDRSETQEERVSAWVADSIRVRLTCAKRHASFPGEYAVRGEVDTEKKNMSWERILRKGFC